MRFLITTLFLAFLVVNGYAQKKEKLKTADELGKYENGWTVKTSLGYSMGFFTYINPRGNAGQDKMGIGGLTSIDAVFRKDRFVWETLTSLELDFTRFGKRNNVTGNPFQKTADVFRFSTKPAHAITDTYKWYVALESTFESQILESYREGNFILVSGEPENLISKFMSPGIITSAPGIDFKPNEHFSLLMSPASLRVLVVADDFLAEGGALGNPSEVLSSGDTIYHNVDVQLGASLKAAYKNTFFKDDRLALGTSLYLFYNYLGGKNKSPGFKNQPVVQWINTLDVKIIEGLSIGYYGAMDYDFNQKVSKNWNPDIADFEDKNETGVQFRQGVYIKYAHVFQKKKEEDKAK